MLGGKMCHKMVKRARIAFCGHYWRYLNRINDGTLEMFRVCPKCGTVERIEV